MSIPINTDNSVQLSYSSFPFAISDIDNYATSNFVSNVSNALRSAINTKQDTLTAATNLLGVGTSITAIDYNKISVNKPTNFQADWNSTIINKPTIYTQSQIDTFLNAKQNNLTAATTLLGTGGSITGINYNTVINKPSYSTPLSSNIATNTISIDLSNYYNQTQVNGLITNTSNYASNISNVLKANIDTKDAILSFTSPLIRTVNTITFSESAITTLTNFYNKTEANNLLNAKQATLSFTSPLVNTANTINFNESAITTLTNFYNKTEANARYLQLAGGDLTGTLNIKTGTSVIHFGTRIIDNLLTLWGDGTSTYGIGINNATLRYNVPTNTTHRFYTGTTNTVTIDGSGNVGIGITNPFASLSIGTPATASDGTLTISRNNAGNRNFKFGYDGGFNFCMGDFGNAVSGNTWRSTDLTINWNTGNIGIGISGQTQKLYVNGSVYITAATTINAALTATSFSGDGANITNVPYSTITGKPTNFQADWNTTIINKPSTFPVDTSIYYNKTETNNLLNAKQATLTFSSPLVKTTNTITFNESAITTLTNFYNKTEANARYLQLDGTNIMTGGLRFNNIVANKVISLYDATPTANNHQFIGFGANNGLVLNTFATADAFQFRVGATTTTSTELMRLSGTGNLAIGTTPFSVNTKLTITGTSTGYSQPLVRIEQLAGWDGNYCIQTVGYSDFGGIRINGADVGNSILKTAATGDMGLTVNNGNILFNANGAERMRIKPNGYVGIGTNNPATHLQVYGSANITNGSALGPPLMQSGSLTIGGINANYGCQYYTGGAWSGTNTAGILMECLNNTEIVIHDSAKRLVSAIAYYGDTTNILYIGRAMGWDSGAATPVNIPASLTVGGIIKSTSGISEFNYVWIHNPGRNDTHFPYTNGENYIRGKLNIDQDGLYVSGNVGIGTQPTLQKLEVNGPTNFTGSLSVQSADLHTFKSPGGLGGNFNCAGNITCLLYAITNSGTDYVGVGNATSGNNNNYLRQLYIMFDTFTGFHRCFTNDELFDNENPQSFKDTYIGRIVVSTGKIATDFKSIDNDDWEIKYDKEGITIEDALPMIEISRKKKDKRVFGVLGNSKRNNSRSERLIINSVGEGGIFVCNSNGNIENGDYIQSSDHLGYGEKQDDDLLHNYTVAKATMDCDFELDNPLYNCFELDDGLRVAFVAATYHCG